MDDANRKDPLQVWADWTPKILAYLTTLGFFSALAGLYVIEVPKENREPLLLMLGSIGTAWVGVMGYYYKSSMASDSRNAVRVNAEAQRTVTVEKIIEKKE